MATDTGKTLLNSVHIKKKGIGLSTGYHDDVKWNDLCGMHIRLIGNQNITDITHQSHLNRII